MALCLMLIVVSINPMGIDQRLGHHRARGFVLYDMRLPDDVSGTEDASDGDSTDEGGADFDRAQAVGQFCHQPWANDSRYRSRLARLKELLANALVRIRQKIHADR